MGVKNKAMLIAYPNRLGNNLSDLNHVMDSYFDNAFGSVHVLPFYYSSGDGGFAPQKYEVDPEFGNWHSVEHLAKEYDLMVDFMINHLSPTSEQFQDVLKNADHSEFQDLFLSFDHFWPKNRPTQHDIDIIYKRKDKAPYQEFTFADGHKEKFWNTFGPMQIDLNVKSTVTQNFISEQINKLMQNGAKIIRLDAVGYATKKIDTNDFFVEPDIWNILDSANQIAHANGGTVLPEVHEKPLYKQKLQEHDYYTYDFVLPFLVMYTLHTKNVRKLANWLQESPMRQFTVLDTHDGIGVADVKGILSDDEINDVLTDLYANSSDVKPEYSSALYHNLDIYQVNTTYYSALKANNCAYLLARAIQIFAPGIPQIYYVGLLAGKNDISYLEKSKEGRNINRHYYTLNEIEDSVKQPIVKSLLDLLRFRNRSSAFDLDGHIDVQIINDNQFIVKRSNKSQSVIATLTINLNNFSFNIEEQDNMKSNVIYATSEESEKSHG